ncbi:MAG: phosphoribosylglycinamide formyltransferase [Acidobacteria bacterium]|nr:phosphoribosylglycinamide formyltransferase [Acidobacteriota bacterium]
MTPIGLFLSGGGGNALNLLRACREGRVDAVPVIGISSSSRAPGVERLEAEGLRTLVFLRSRFESDQAYSEACLGEAEAAGAQIVCLCGWLKKLVLPPVWAGRILNIHPALLPRFGGPGMYGMNVHRAVLDAGEAESGATVHLVDDEYDHGAILAQLKVPVLQGDTPEELQKRVYSAEMELYPRALDAFIRRRVLPGPRRD